MKAEADIDFIMGENQLIFHGWPYSPPAGQVPEPGWSLYAAASFNDHNPWHPVEPAVNAYIARLSYLLRQGQPANQVAILLPTDDAWATFSPATPPSPAPSPSSSPPTSCPPSFPPLQRRLHRRRSHRQSRPRHPPNPNPPPTDRIPADTATKLAAWAATGGKIISVGRLPSLTPDGKPLTISTAEIALIPDEASLAKALPTPPPPTSNSPETTPPSRS